MGTPRRTARRGRLSVLFSVWQQLSTAGAQNAAFWEAELAKKKENSAEVGVEIPVVFFFRAKTVERLLEYIYSFLLQTLSVYANL
jgi:hypothetical protein